MSMIFASWLTLKLTLSIFCRVAFSSQQQSELVSALRRTYGQLDGSISPVTPTYPSRYASQRAILAGCAQFIVPSIFIVRR